MLKIFLIFFIGMFSFSKSKAEEKKQDDFIIVHKDFKNFKVNKNYLEEISFLVDVNYDNDNNKQIKKFLVSNHSTKIANNLTSARLECNSYYQNFDKSDKGQWIIPDDETFNSIVLKYNTIRTYLNNSTNIKENENTLFYYSFNSDPDIFSSAFWTSSFFDQNNKTFYIFRKLEPKIDKIYLNIKDNGEFNDEANGNFKVRCVKAI